MKTLKHDLINSFSPLRQVLQEYDLSEILLILREILRESGREPHLEIKGHKILMFIAMKNPGEAIRTLKLCMEQDNARKEGTSI